MSAVSQQQRTCAGPHVGTWKLESLKSRDIETGETTEPYGAHPIGYLSYGPDCRMYAIIARQNRKPPAAVVATDPERIELFAGVAAYAGTYTIKGDQVSHHVDVSWNEAWTGTTQVRQFKIEGNTLQIRSAPAKNPLDGRLSSATLIWIKVQ